MAVQKLVDQKEVYIDRQIPIGFVIKYLQPGSRSPGIKLYPRGSSRLRKRTQVKQQSYAAAVSLLYAENFMVNSIDCRFDK